MAWNGSGTYVLNPTYSPEVNGTTIDAVRYNGLLTDVAAGITAALAKNGENVPTANIGMGGFKLTGLAAATSTGDALSYGNSLGPVTATTGTFSGAVSGTTGTFSGNVQMASLNGTGNALAGLRNRAINGNFYNDQRNAGASQTITAGAALAYTVDRFYAYCTGANVTGQRVAGTAPNAYLYRFTGAASVTKIGFAQRFEDLNCQDMAGKTATLSVDLANSLLTTVTWTAWYANTANTFGTLASPTRTLISTGTFTVTSTLTRYNTNISIPAAATTGIEIELSVGAQISGTWNISNFQLEPGSVATPFEQRPIGMELALCQRYFQLLLNGGIGTNNAATVISRVTWPLFVAMRSGPTIAFFSGSPAFFQGSNTANYSSVGSTYITTTTAQADINVTGGAATAGLASIQKAESGVFSASAEL
jgi:hypothetical protein